MLNADPRVLLVESQTRIRRSISNMLQSSGVKTVHHAPTGENAREILINQPVDFVLCDWDAQKGSGLEFLEKVRSIPVTKNLPFLMMSGTGRLDEEDLAVADDFDVSGHLFKPINQENLEDKIQTTIDSYDSMVEVLTHLARSAALADMNEKDEAEKELLAARMWNDSGDVYADMGESGQAQDCYKKAIAIDRKSTRAFDRLGDLYQKVGDEDRAIEFYQTATKMSPSNSGRQLKLAKIFISRGDNDGARTAIQHAVQGEKDEAARSAAAAEFYLSVDRADLAEQEYSFAIQGDPENVLYYNRLGIAFRRQKKYKEAVENYRKALTFSPGDPILFFNMARALIEMRDIPQAVASLRMALMINPNFKQAETLLKNLQKNN